MRILLRQCVILHQKAVENPWQKTRILDTNRGNDQSFSVVVVVSSWCSELDPRTVKLSAAISLLCAFAKFREAAISFVMSVRAATWNNSAATGRIFMKFSIWIFFKICRECSIFFLNLARTMDTLHENLCTFIISRSVLLRTRNVSDKSCTEDQNTFWMCNNFFP